eukprot:1148297-Pelagomonas_calceolata.AAC.9
MLFGTPVRTTQSPDSWAGLNLTQGIAGNEFAFAITKHQAIQGDDAPADTTFPCVNLEGDPLLDTTWLAFEEGARTHASTSECPNSSALKL